MVSPDPNSPDRQCATGILRFAAPGAAEADPARAQSLGLEVGPPPAADGTLWLQRVGGRLSLCGLGQPFAVDFERGPLARRLRTATRGDPLARAIGLHRRPAGRVLDPTAGWLRDAATLARLGCAVVAAEREPVVHWLAEDGLDRASGEWAQRVELHPGSGEALLVGGGPWDAVYLDPMFDANDTGSAAPSKDGQLLRALAGHGSRHDRELLAAARACDAARVVVKRHPNAPPLAGRPSFAVDGQRARFDVYLRTNAQAT